MQNPIGFYTRGCLGQKHKFKHELICKLARDSSKYARSNQMKLRRLKNSNWVSARESSNRVRSLQQCREVHIELKQASPKGRRKRLTTERLQSRLIQILRQRCTACIHLIACMHECLFVFVYTNLVVCMYQKFCMYVVAMVYDSYMDSLKPQDCCHIISFAGEDKEKAAEAFEAGRCRHCNI